MDQEGLRRRIRERLARGELPRGEPQHTRWIAEGTGQVCAVCDTIIGPETIEIEAYCANDKTFYYHRDCCMMFLHERDGKG